MTVKELIKLCKYPEDEMIRLVTGYHSHGQWKAENVPYKYADAQVLSWSITESGKLCIEIDA